MNIETFLAKDIQVFLDSFKKVESKVKFQEKILDSTVSFSLESKKLGIDIMISVTRPDVFRAKDECFNAFKTAANTLKLKAEEKKRKAEQNKSVAVN